MNLCRAEWLWLLWDSDSFNSAFSAAAAAAFKATTREGNRRGGDWSSSPSLRDLSLARRLYR